MYNLNHFYNLTLFIHLFISVVDVYKRQLFTLNETNTKKNAFAVKRGLFAFYTRFIFYYFLVLVSFKVKRLYSG